MPMSSPLTACERMSAKTLRYESLTIGGDCAATVILFLLAKGGGASTLIAARGVTLREWLLAWGSIERLSSWRNDEGDDHVMVAPLTFYGRGCFLPQVILWGTSPRPRSPPGRTGVMAADSDTVALLQGTLDVLVLKAVSWGPAHGYGVARWLQDVTDDALRIEEGSLYPALHRLEKRGFVEASW